ncbi:MAG: hypothetical protein ACRDSP_11160 [Pseudonocardiaceae bacterium]
MNPRRSDVRAPRWALSPLDYRAHAVDEYADHPWGVFIALCGHRLLAGDLSDVPPGGLCVACGVTVVAHRRGAAAARWASSRQDWRSHAMDPGQVDLARARAWVEALCGQCLPSASLVVHDAPASPMCWRCVLPELR